MGLWGDKLSPHNVISVYYCPLNNYILATGCQKHIEVDDEGRLQQKLHTFSEKCMATDTDTLGEEKKDYVVQIGGNNKQGFPWSKVSWLMTHDCYWVKGIPVIDWGRPEEKRAHLYGFALWMPIWVFSIWSSLKIGRRIFLDSLIPLCLIP